MMHMIDIYYRRNTNSIMLLVLIACIPGILIEFYYFGYGVLLQILISIFIALLSEFLVLMIRNRIKYNIINDYSSIVTAVLFSISLPPLLPWWLTVIGTIFAIIIVKHIYGGLGYNLFNPAMSSYVLLLISYPVFMTNWTVSPYFMSHSKNFYHAFNTIFFSNYKLYNKDLLSSSCDFVTQATPLDKFKTDMHIYDERKLLSITQYNIFKDSLGWFWINFGFLLGGIFLLMCNIICWRIPFYFLCTLLLLSTIGYYFLKILLSPMFHLFSGGTMLCAFFIATDPVTMPITNMGKIIFSILIGVLVWIIRSFGGYPDAVAFSILLANTTVPLIDYYSRSRSYGR